MKKSPEDLALDNEYWVGQHHMVDRLLDFLKAQGPLIDRDNLRKELSGWVPVKRDER